MITNTIIIKINAGAIACAVLACLPCPATAQDDFHEDYTPNVAVLEPGQHVMGGGSDGGARNYDAMRFTTMDPRAEEYYDVSPYAYCMNNPINAFDPDGCVITYTNNADGKKYVYYQGNFYSFKQENGTIVPKGFPVHVPNRGYMHRTLMALRQLENFENEIIMHVFSTVSDIYSGVEHNISAGIIGKGSSTTFEGRFTFIKLNFEYDMQNERKFGTVITDVETIGHELKHSYDGQFYKNSRKKDKHDIHIDEYYTVNFENLIRKEEKVKSRTNYSGNPIPEDLIGKITLWKSEQ